MSSNDHRVTRERLIMRTSAAPLLLGLFLLGACATEKGPGNPDPVTPSERYSIDVHSAPEELKLAAHATGLSPAQQAALSDFVRRWMLAEGGDITVKAPEHVGDRANGYRTVTEARDYLIDVGVSARRVHIASYDPGDDHAAPIIVGYLRYEAKGPECGREWGDLAAESDNREYSNFGCSLTANVAAQIANPADLLSPRESDPPDAQRRQTVTDLYRKGQITSTLKDNQADGTFSKAGQ
jgi:pilus assembly protein CpaD